MTTTISSAPFYSRIRRVPGNSLPTAQLGTIPLYFIVTFLIVVRLFTERLGILPRAFNAIDLVAVPLLIPVVVIESLLRRQLRVRWPSLLVLSGVFGYSWAIAWITNSAEVHWFGALLFVVGLLTPVLFFLIVVNFDLSDRFP